MPVPDLDAWQARFDTAPARRLGVAPEAVESGFASFMVQVPYGDGRDDDPLFFATALHYAADIAALSAVIARCDQEQPNGTASLHLNVLADPQGAVRVWSRVVHWGMYSALLELAAEDATGALVARGLTGYSLRPAAADVAS